MLLTEQLKQIPDHRKAKCTSFGGNTSQQNFTSLVSVYDDQAAGVVQLQSVMPVFLIRPLAKVRSRLCRI